MGVVGSVCLAVWFQFLYFKGQTNRDSSVQSAEAPVQLTARDRFRAQREKARAASDRLELQKLIAASQTPRSVVMHGLVQSHSEASVNPPSPPPWADRARTPPVYGSGWGRESDPALSDFSKWAKDYADATAAERALLTEQGLALAEARREAMV